MPRIERWAYYTEPEIRARLDAIDRELRELDAGDGDVPALQEERLDLAQALNRRTHVRSAAARPASTEAGATFDRSRPSDDGDPRTRPARDAALATIERAVNTAAMGSHAADSLDDLVRHRDPLGTTAHYLDAVGSDDYLRAFAKMAADPLTGHLRFTPAEAEAVQTASRAMSLTGASGGFAVPFTLDPSITLSSNGSLNPIRALARVEQITTDQWRGVTSAGVTAGYAAELTEVGDNSPTLAQPVIDTARGQAFVPFSIEIGMDWGAIATEMAGLLRDARDQVDATAFLTGTGVDAPRGILTDLTTAQRVQTAGTAAYAVADVYSLKQALPARFYPTSTFAMNPATVDTTYRFVSAGSTSEPALMRARASSTDPSSSGPRWRPAPRPAPNSRSSARSRTFWWRTVWAPRSNSSPTSLERPSGRSAPAAFTCFGGAGAARWCPTRSGTWRPGDAPDPESPG